MFNQQRFNNQRSLIARFSVLVPIHVQRGLIAAQTRRPPPLMTTARTPTVRRERIPHRAARLEERLGSAVADARPAARWLRTPATQRTSNGAKRVLLFEARDRRDDLIGPSTLLQEKLN